MKIVTPIEMKEIEQNTARYNMTTLRLMENAGSAAATFIRKKLDVTNRNCMIFCGKGNNGGDGFVVARKLYEWGANVIVVLTDGAPTTADSRKMLDDLALFHVLVLDYAVQQSVVQSYLSTADIIVDAIYGSGFYGELDAVHVEITSLINTAITAVVALDVPSGVNCGTAGCDPHSVCADFTVVFDTLKPAHLFPKELDCLGEVEVVDIGILPEAYEGVGEDYFEWDEEKLFYCLPPKASSSHKGCNGRLLNIAGSMGMAGAAVLSTLGGLRSGAGYVTLALPQEVYPHVTPHLISAVCLLLGEDSSSALDAALEENDAIALGCGIGNSEFALHLVEKTLTQAKIPVVLDADGINALSRDITILKKASCPLILTPHVGEFARLIGKSVAEVKAGRLPLARSFAAENQVVLVLKGANTIVAEPNGLIFVNNTGNAGLAKAGSGDVLTGMIASFAAQGIPLFEAAVCGVYLHGLMAERCSKRLSQYAMQPMELLEDLCLFFAQNER